MRPIYTLEDLIDMLRRRAGMIITIILLGCAASVFAALSMPHVYQSSEVIQVKLPEITNSLAPSTVEGSSVQRLQLIEQQLMARGNLIEIIEKYDLYADLPALRMSEKVNLLRSSVTITGVAGPERDERYVPQISVMGVMTPQEGDGARISVMTFTVEMSDPADAQALAREFSERTRELSAAQRREQTRETLEFFQQQEENLIREIAEVEAKRVDFRVANDLTLEGSLVFRQAEIASLNEAILALDREIIATRMSRDRATPDARAATIEREKAELSATLESLTAQRNALEEQREALISSLQNSPEVDRELTRFERRLAQLQGQLEVITARRNEAEVGFRLEVDGRGETLTTLEKAELPEYPIASPRKKMAAIGGLASVALALIAAFLLELRRPVIRSAALMERETGLIPVVSIPDLSPREKRRTLGKVWQERLKAGREGRAARQAPNKARQR
ncbi:MAG: Wzz/FepE/Etk N-terminal domain-containing protein [Sulfitobacter sp.]|uniref:Wzz/FepE/Etk N-terminal domain-containing protein n=1 Tax=Alphaproteobacteria TaxID=28211 RepID=UPI0032988F52